MKQLIQRLARAADAKQYEPLRRRREDEEGREKKWRRNRDVQAGHVPVFVGEEMERFVVPASMLGRPAFLELLRRSAAEYGYEQSGVLRIPCSVPLFSRVVRSLSSASSGRFEAEILRSFEDDEVISTADRELRQMN